MLFWKKKEKKEVGKAPESDIFKFTKEDIDKIQEALDKLNNELLANNNEKLKMAGVIS